ncbi:hypothetical protein GCM10009599_14380 [Luteococcus peritonei]
MQQGWITEHRKRAGHASVWKVTRARRPSVLANATCMDAIDVLADPTCLAVKSPLARVILSASHEGWDALGGAAFVEAVRQCDLGFDELPETMGRQAHSKARSLLKAEGFDAWMAWDAQWLTTWLDDVAQRHGAVEKRCELQASYDTKKAERVASLAAVKSTRNDITPAPKNPDELQEWMQAMLRVVLSHRGDAALQRDAAKTIIKRIEKKHSNASARWWMFMAGQWTRFAPMPDGTRPSEQVKKARLSIAGDVARVLMGTAPTTDNPQALAAIDAGAMWVREQIGWGTRKQESVRPAEGARAA